MDAVWSDTVLKVPCYTSIFILFPCTSFHTFNYLFAKHNGLF